MTGLLLLASFAYADPLPEVRGARWSHVSIGVGSAAVITGFTMGAWSLGTATEARNAGWRASAAGDLTGWTESQRAHQGAQKPWTGAIISTGTGGALVTAGLLDLALRRRSHR